MVAKATRVCKSGTHISPASHHIIDIIAPQWEVDDALVDRFTAALRRQIFLRDAHPTQRSNGESDWLLRVPLTTVTTLGSDNFNFWKFKLMSPASYFSMTTTRMAST